MVMALLSVENLGIEFDTDEGVIRAVDGVSFSIKPGESLGLVGESGCGKSVTALGITRLIPSPPGRIFSGRVDFDGRNLLELSVPDLRDIRGNEITMIFQEPLSALSPLHRIGRQLTEAIFFHRRMSKKQAFEFARLWLTKVGIPDAEARMQAYPFQLSGGMQQRVMIAMALMLEPKLIIADEPTTALDATTQAQIFALIRKMKQNHTAMLLITHDMGVVWEMCDRVMVMYASRIVESAGLEDIFNAPAHPYTRGLMAAIPRLAKGRNYLKAIEGQVPSPGHYPQGCRFQDRCPEVFERCRKEDPRLMQCGKDHMAACFLAYPDREA
jgi:peptide/nickel transport system ATP-binding protein/oligopeptide transport system ATP-binding protein